MSGGSDNMLYQVAAEFALWHRIEGVARKFLAQQPFERELLNFALQLLRALFGLALQIFDLPLHRCDLLFLFSDLETQRIFGFLFGLLANCGQLGLHLLLDGQVDLAHGIVEFALLSDQIGLRLLRLGELGVTLLQHVVEFGDLPGPVFQIGGEQPLGFLGLGRCDSPALFINLGGHLRVDVLPGHGNFVALLPDGRFPCSNFGLLAGDLGLISLAGVGDQRSRERLRQLYLGAAGRAGQCWFGHGCCLEWQARIGDSTVRSAQALDVGGLSPGHRTARWERRSPCISTPAAGLQT